MKPQSTDQDDLLLFQAHFDQMLNPAHPLLKLDATLQQVESIAGATDRRWRFNTVA